MKRQYWPTVGVSVVAAAALGWALIRDCPEGKVRSGLQCVSEQIDPSGSGIASDPNGITDPGAGDSVGEPAEATPDRFSRGERILLTDEGNPDSEAGAAAMASGEYQNAISSFSRAVDSSGNEPEPQIYLNNAIARRQGNPYTIAVVVPVDGRSDVAREMLRGVADAQARFEEDSSRDRLIEIVIANDGNDPQMAASIARKLAEDPSVLGVIGHNSSSATEPALPIYERAGLAVISPTSTSTSLSSDTFFRTVPSDAGTGEKLAAYATNQLNADNVVAFYASGSSYSESLLQAFTDNFSGEVTAEVDLTAEDFDFDNEIDRISGGVDAILLFPNTKMVPRAIGIAKANRKLLEGRFALLGGDALYQSNTLRGGVAVEGMVLAVPWFADTAYADDAEARWGGQISWRTASSYDAGQAFANALSGDASRESVLSAMGEIRLSGAETSGNPLRFEGGDRAEEPLLVQATRDGNKPQGSQFGFELISE
ncbi:MAG: ABC transporter substrate-binding protein [Cyanobacteria bacterium P01_D01_bin.1]